MSEFFTEDREGLTSKGRDLARRAAKWCAPEVADAMARKSAPETAIFWREVAQAARARGTTKTIRDLLGLRLKLVLADLRKEVGP